MIQCHWILWWDTSSQDVLTYVMETTSHLHIKPIEALSTTAQTGWGLLNKHRVGGILVVWYFFFNVKWMVQLFPLPFIEVTLLGLAFCLISLAAAPACFLCISFLPLGPSYTGCWRKVKGGKVILFNISEERQWRSQIIMMMIALYIKRKYTLSHHWEDNRFRWHKTKEVQQLSWFNSLLPQGNLLCFHQHGYWLHPG